jgi:hypothetical protein
MKRYFIFIIYVFIALVCVLGSVELFARILHVAKYGTEYDKTVLMAFQDVPVIPQERQNYVEGGVEFGIHPYFGYILTPKQHVWNAQQDLSGQDLALAITETIGCTRETGFPITLRADGFDPNCLLSLPTLSEKNFWRVNVTLQTDSTDNAKLYFATKGNQFDEDNSISRSVSPGINEISFLLESDSPIVSLRFDPGNFPGVYRIHSISLYAMEKFSSEASITSVDWGDKNKLNATHGFPFNDTVLSKVIGDASRIKILLLGGSVAQQMGVPIPILQDELQKKIDKIGVTKKVDVFVAAIGGYKEPQQIFAALFFLLQGFHFDMILNFDGFNDIVLPLAENKQANVNPFFPRKWDMRYFNKNIVRSVARIEELNEEREALLKDVSKNSLFRLAFIGTVWRFRLERIRREQSAIMTKLAMEEKNFDQIGPVYNGSDEVLLADSAAIWAKGSRFLNSICGANGIEYYHFLQPNQYVEGSKPFSEEERRDFIIPSGYGPIAARGYPLLREEGRRMQADGLVFKDLSEIFADEQRTVYLDSCCHFNRLGLKLIAESMATFIVESSPLLAARR